jgi:hypothetical protein
MLIHNARCQVCTAIGYVTGLVDQRLLLQCEYLARRIGSSGRMFPGGCGSPIPSGLRSSKSPGDLAEDNWRSCLHCQAAHGIALRRKAAKAQPGRTSSLHMAVLAGADFFTVEFLTRRGLVTYYVLFLLHLEPRPVTLAVMIRHSFDDVLASEGL